MLLLAFLKINEKSPKDSQLRNHSWFNLLPDLTTHSTIPTDKVQAARLQTLRTSLQIIDIAKSNPKVITQRSFKCTRQWPLLLASTVSQIIEECLFTIMRKKWLPGHTTFIYSTNIDYHQRRREIEREFLHKFYQAIYIFFLIPRKRIHELPSSESDHSPSNHQSSNLEIIASFLCSSSITSGYYSIMFTFSF